MLIDQFTEEEIAQIRRELKELQQLHKSSISEENWKEIDRLFGHKSYCDQCLFPYRAVGDAISVIADYTLDNFVYKHHGRSKKQIGWYRSQTVPQDKQETYRQIGKDILKVIEKYRKHKDFPLVKPNLK